MEDVKRKNEHLEVLLAENKLLKRQTQEQEEEMAELKEEREGDGYLHDFLVPFSCEICLTCTYRERKSNEEVVY